jgi:small subunit ribosomal protein S5
MTDEEKAQVEEETVKEEEAPVEAPVEEAEPAEGGTAEAPPAEATAEPGPEGAEQPGAQEEKAVETPVPAPVPDVPETREAGSQIGVAQHGPLASKSERRDDARGGPRGGRGGRGRGQQRQRQAVEVDVGAWQPKTKLGKMVQEGKITNLSQALDSGLPLREATIVDIFLPELEDDVLDINMVQRMTDSGRRVKFSITTVVGNRDGFIGLGRAKGKEVGPTIRKAIENAKMNIIEIKRGCGSWQCGCGRAHSLPFAIAGKSGSVEISLKPAARGAGLSTGDIPSRILSLAGFEDVQSFAKGQTRTTVNFAKAVFDALLTMEKTRIGRGLAAELHIVNGPTGGV